MKKITPQHIDDYLLGRLNNEILHDFEIKLKQDPEFAKEVEEKANAINFLEYAGDQEIKQKLKTIHRRVISAPLKIETQQITRTRWFAIAASFLLLILAAYWLISSPLTTPSSAKLFETYYEQPSIAFGSRGLENQKELIEANQLYTKGAFEDALKILTPYLKEQQNSKAQLTAGVCFMEISDYQNALVQFNNLIQNEDVLFSEQALWFAALSHLQLNDQEQCNVFLKRLLAYPNPYKQKEAQELLKALQ